MRHIHFIKLGLAIFSFLNLTACLSEESTQRISNIKDQVVSSVQDIREMVGANVETLDGVNSKLVTASADMIKLFEEFKFDIGFKENGITFQNNKGLSGVVGINGDTLFLDLTATTKDADTVKSILRIANVFSNNNTIEDRIQSAINQNSEQEIQLNNGYIKSNNTTIQIYLENYL